MKSTFKSVISLLLVLIFVFQLFPASSFAVETESGDYNEPTECTESSDAPEEEESEQNNAVNDAEDESISEESEESFVVGEAEDLRDESVKHYRMNDGTFMAVEYGYPIHYKDVEDKWIDIDNTLEKAGDKLVSVNGDMTKSFPDSLASGELFDLQYKEYAIKMSLVSKESETADDTDQDVSAPAETILPSESTEPDSESPAPDESLSPPESSEPSPETNETPEIQEPDMSPVPEPTPATESSAPTTAPESTQTSANYSRLQNAAVKAAVENPVSAEKVAGESSLEDMIALDKINSTVRFENAINSTDIVYENLGYDLKESIVIREQQTEYQYAFALELTGLTPVLQETGSILLNNNQNEPIFEIPAPYMYDADGAVSDQVKYALVQTNDGFILTVSADAAWINATDRVFPVTLDPTVTLYNTTTIKATFVTSNQPTYSFPASEVSDLYCGRRNSTNYGNCEIVMQAQTLPVLPANCVLVNAQISLVHCGFYDSNFNAASSGSLVIQVQRLSSTSDNVSGLTYNGVHGTNGLGVVSRVLDCQTLTHSTLVQVSSKPVYWDVTSAALDWLNAGQTRGAVLLSAPDCSNQTRFAVLFRPEFENHYVQFYFQYRNVVGLEDYYTYQEASAGRAGSVSINDFTQKMTLAHEDVSLSLASMDYSITHYYNSCLTNSHFTTSSTYGTNTCNFDSMRVGRGWKLSVQQTIVSKKIGEYTYLIYTDGDGTEHYFFESDGVYKDEDGLGLTITKTTSGNNTTYTMKDEDVHNTWTFYNGYLIKQRDFNGNEIRIAYNSEHTTQNTSWYPNYGQANRIVQVVQHTNSAISAPYIVVATFSYNESDNYLSTITDYAGRVTSFSYNSNGRLVSITHQDGTTMYYSYRTAGEMICAYDGEAKNGLEFSYWGANDSGTGYTHTVNQLKEFYAETSTGTRTYGNQMHCYRNSSQLTSMRLYGADHTSETSDDLVVYNAFDYYGRTITSYTTDWEKKKMLGVSAGIYKPNSSSTPATNNRLARSANSGQHVENKIMDSGLEHSLNNSGWTVVRVGYNYPGNANAAVNTYYNYEAGHYTGIVYPHTGENQLKTFLGGQATVGRGTVYLKQGVSLSKDTYYTFSAYVNTSTLSALDPEDPTHGAYLAFIDSDENFCKTSEVINYYTEPTIANGWERISVTYMPPASGTYYLAVVQKGVLGITAFDDVQLELGKTMSKVNLVQNAGFEKHDSNQNALYWNTVGCYYQSNLGNDRLPGGGTWMVRLTGSYSQDNEKSQTININLPWDTTFLLSGWGKAESVFYDIKDSYTTYDSFFGLIAVVNYSTGDSETYYIPFSPMYTGWQYTSGVIAPKTTKADGVKITSIDVKYSYKRNANYAYYDNISLVQEPAQTYSYDSKGNPVAATSDKARSSYEYFSGTSKLKKYTTPSGTIHTFTYQSDGNGGTTNNIQSETVDGLSNYSYYNKSGSVVTNMTRVGTSGSFLKATNTYNDSENHRIASTDVNGVTTTYTYGSTTHFMLSSHTGGDSRVTQKYDRYTSNGRMYQTKDEDGVLDTLTYGYQNGRLHTLSRKSFRPTENESEPFWQKYIIAYNEFGSNTYVGVTGKASADASYPTSKKLVSYNYEETVNSASVNNGRLCSMVYPNGNTVGYTYNLFDRLTKESYNNSDPTYNKQHKYYYDAEGSLARQESVNNSGSVTETYIYDYDSLGRLIHSKELGTENSFVQRTEHQYDTSNRLTKQNWVLADGAKYTQSYSYSNGSEGDETLTKITSNFSVGGYSYSPSITFSYNTLRQLLHKTTGSMFYRAYSYKNGAETSQKTALVDYMNYRQVGSGDDNPLILGFRYYYNDLGFISSVWNTENVGQSNATADQTYTYDQLGQLTHCTDYVAGKKYDYTYDTAGNILSLIRKPLNSSSAENTIQLSYGGSMWKDRLTKVKVNGTEETITYETAISGFISGNPISYYNGEHYDFTWKNGRQLASASVNGTTVTYDYDMSGVRSQKKVGNIVYNYDTLSGLVVHQRWDDTKNLYFVYDENNQPYAVFYRNGSGSLYRYYYLLNQQGDVMALLNGNKEIVAQYRYDPWGVPTLVSDSTNIRIGEKNPLLYRGYYYDSDTGLYYLQSRYYDPAIGRFINADTFATTDANGFLSCNMFAYCLNNPVQFADHTGCSPVWSLKSDWAGRAILFHWLFGSGKDYFGNDTKWGDYMRANELLNQQIEAIVDANAVSIQYSGSKTIDLTTSAEIENGEDIIGYQYLHGTNADVGGFRVVGSISKSKIGDVSYKLSCTWNDLIDPNFIYSSDQKKAAFAQRIPFANPTNYYIAITWTVSGQKHTRSFGNGKVVATIM